MSSDQQHMQRRLRRNQRLDDADVVQNAGRGGIADHSFNVLCLDAVDDRLHRVAGSGSIDQIHVVSILDRDPGRVSQPLGVVECSTLGNGGTTLLAGKTRVKGWIQKQYTHR